MRLDRGRRGYEKRKNKNNEHSDYAAAVITSPRSSKGNLYSSVDGPIRAAQQGGALGAPPFAKILQEHVLRLSAGTLLVVGLGRSKAYMDVSTTNRLSTGEEDSRCYTYHICGLL